MAMDSATLAAAMKAKCQAKLSTFSSAIGDDMDLFFAALAEATVEHIVSAGQVTVVSVAGVTTGSGVSGAGTGTIS